MSPYILKRLWRRPWLSLCSLVLAGAMCFLLCFMTGYLSRQEAQLAETRTSFEILCVATTRDGSQATGLRMPSMYIGATGEGSELEPFIRDLRMTKELTYTSLDLYRADHTSPDHIPLIGVTNERCADPLNPALGGDVVYLTEDFYQSREHICLVSEEHYQSLQELQPEVGGGIYTIGAMIEDPYIDREILPDMGIGRMELTIVGYYKGKGEAIYMPFNGCADLVVALSGRMSCDSIAFIAADNDKLEELMKAAESHFGEVVPAGSPHADPAYALTIHDEVYRSTLAALEQNIRRTRLLLPVLLLLGLGLGFLISTIATRSERLNYALMRTMGLTRGRLLLSVLVEQTTLPMLAALTIAALLGQMLPAMAYLACHCIGCAACIFRAIRVPPTAILREQE